MSSPDNSARQFGHRALHILTAVDKTSKQAMCRGSRATADSPCAIVGLILLMSLGCNSAEQAQRKEEARRQATVNNLRQIGEDLHKNQETLASPDSEFTHVIAKESEYYTTGPQQGLPPDGTFPAGTKVHIVEEAGSYVLVRSEGGIEAYVASGTIRN